MDICVNEVLGGMFGGCQCQASSDAGLYTKLIRDLVNLLFFYFLADSAFSKGTRIFFDF